MIHWNLIIPSSYTFAWSQKLWHRVLVSVLQACCSTATRRGRKEEACRSSSTCSIRRATNWSTSPSSSVCLVGFPPPSAKQGLKCSFIWWRREGNYCRFIPPSQAWLLMWCCILHTSWIRIVCSHVIYNPLLQLVSFRMLNELVLGF